MVKKAKIKAEEALVFKVIQVSNKVVVVIIIIILLHFLNYLNLPKYQKNQRKELKRKFLIVLLTFRHLFNVEAINLG